MVLYLSEHLPKLLTFTLCFASGLPPLSYVLIYNALLTEGLMTPCILI